MKSWELAYLIASENCENIWLGKQSDWWTTRHRDNRMEKSKGWNKQFNAWPMKDGLWDLACSVLSGKTDKKKTNVFGLAKYHCAAYLGKTDQYIVKDKMKEKFKWEWPAYLAKK